MSDGLSYRDSGVDIAAADALVDQIKNLAAGTLGSETVQHKLGYAALYRPQWQALKDPLIATTCDGVGTKLLVARMAQSYGGLGQDLVAMSVNDLLPVGAQPLLFLEYFATGALEPRVLAEIAKGVANACKESRCALIGGETAEMPGVYPPGEFDLAGFAVGLADGANLPDPATISPGDVLLALPSSGIHSNGFSLARKALFERAKWTVDTMRPELGCTLGEALLVPTALYVSAVRALREKFAFKAAAHITGGGLLGRLSALNANVGFQIHIDAAEAPALFAVIAEAGKIAPAEMLRTFNMGWGFVAVVAPDTAEQIQRDLPMWQGIGTVTKERAFTYGSQNITIDET